jgi:beta-glucosidase
MRATVVQLYLSMPQDSVLDGTPVKALRGFEKVYLEPGGKRDVDLHIGEARC